MSKLKIILGATRPTRAADRVVPWVTSVAAVGYSAGIGGGIRAIEQARAGGELLPGKARMRAAMLNAESAKGTAA